MTHHASTKESQCSIDAHNNPLTDETLDAAKKADAIILGAVGGPVRASTTTMRYKHTDMYRNGELARFAPSRVS